MARGERRRPALGDDVRVSAADPDEFRRVPGYLRGQVGVVVGECGDKPLPVGYGVGEVLGDPEPVLTVRFDVEQVFGGTGRGGWLHADLWVSNLEPTSGGSDE
jgi:hypothetical protein